MSERPEDIQKRLAGIDDIGQVVGALRAIAAGQVGAVRAAVDAVDAYAGTIEQALVAATAGAGTATATATAGTATATATAAVASGADGASGASGTGGTGGTGGASDAGNIAGAPGPSKGQGLLLVVGAGQGFSGAYATRLAERARIAMRERPGLLVVGQRTLEILRADGLPILWSEDLPSHPAAIPALASRVTDRLVGLSTEHPGLVRAVVGDVEHHGAPVERTLFPPPAIRPPAGAGGSRPLTTLPVADLVAGLLEEALFAAVVHALIQGLAAEAQARVETMARAQRNMRTRRTEVERRYQQARQEQMTTEMIELVVSGL
ncbi:MAG: F0F1 ATP synthase subunit gamma [Burkholderiaceae bacterium]